MTSTSHRIVFTLLVKQIQNVRSLCPTETIYIQQTFGCNRFSCNSIYIQALFIRFTVCRTQFLSRLFYCFITNETVAQNCSVFLTYTGQFAMKCQFSRSYLTGIAHQLTSKDITSDFSWWKLHWNRFFFLCLTNYILIKWIFFVDKCISVEIKMIKRN